MAEVLIKAAKAVNRMFAGARCLLLTAAETGGIVSAVSERFSGDKTVFNQAQVINDDPVLALLKPLRGLGAHVRVVTGCNWADPRINQDDSAIFSAEKTAAQDAGEISGAPDFVFADEQTVMKLLQNPAALYQLGAQPLQLPPLLVGVTATGSVFVPPVELFAAGSLLSAWLAPEQQRAGVCEFSLPKTVQSLAAESCAAGNGAAERTNGAQHTTVLGSSSSRNIAVLVSENPRWQSAEPAARIAWAARGMPVTAGMIRELAEQRSISGQRVLVSLVLEPKTAALALMLQRTGAEVAVFAAASETDPGVAAALAAAGVRVFAAVNRQQLRDPGLDAAGARAALNWGPHWLIDDGAHLIRLAHTEVPSALETLLGAAEETTSGVRPLREMAAAGELRLPVIAVNDAATKTLFDNRVGTGESCVIAALDLICSTGEVDDDPDNDSHNGNGAMPKQLRSVVIYGYGPVGQGCARAARSFGLAVSVIEPNPVRALSAVVDGYTVGRPEQLLPAAELVISATGVWQTIGYEHQKLLKPGTYICVAGGIDGEVAQPVVQGLRLLADGGGINYTAGEGNPLAVMDLSFATQVAALSQLVTAHTEAKTAAKVAGKLPGSDNQFGFAPGIYPVNDTAVQRVASMALRVNGCGLPDPVTPPRTGGAAQHWRVHRYKKTN